MNKIMTECPICNSENRAELLKFENTYQFIHDKFHKFELIKYYCNQCEHIYTGSFENFLIQEHYESTRNSDAKLIYSGAENLNKTFDNLVQWMKTSLKQKNSQINTILDIGCGKCDLLKSFSFQYPHSVLYGIDYSPQIKQFAQEKGIQNIIVGDFYTEIFHNQKFDLISATGVMEHQIDIHRFIEKIISLLNESGYLLIEVPDSLSILESRPDLKSKSMHDLYNDEHIHHFKTSNLITFIEKYGFKLLSSRTISRGDWDDINLVFQHEDNHLSVIDNFRTKRDLDRKKINNLLNSKKLVAIYGAGWHTTHVLPAYYKLDFSKILTIFDQDKRKVGEHIYNIKIEYPSPNALGDVDYIIISSVNMTDSIYDYLVDNGIQKHKILRLY